MNCELKTTAMMRCVTGIVRETIIDWELWEQLVWIVNWSRQWCSVMITSLPVRLKSRHVDRLTWTYVTIIVVPPQYNNDNHDPCTTLLHGFAERGFNGTMYWTPTNALMDCTEYSVLWSRYTTPNTQIQIRKYRCCNMLCTDLLAWHVDTLTCTDLCYN